MQQGGGMRVFDETVDRSFLFSVLIPVYNTAEYLPEAIDSIVDQTIGFEKNIQIVLVNDGSSDDSGEVCREYQRRFPNNIAFVDKENEGVSIARNIALSLARGDFVNCLDSDDYWTLDAFECAARFFLEHPDINLAAARHVFFGRFSSAHALSYKFAVDKVVDIHSRFDYPQLSFSNAFVRRELIPDNPFNPTLKVAEDFAIINTILLDEGKYGILERPTYWYRKRSEATSAIDTAQTSLSWYFDTPKYCYKRLMDRSVEKFGKVIPYIQYCVMYDLQWRLKPSKGCPLDEEQGARYKELISSLLERIDDEVICIQRNLTREEKLLAFSLKYGLPVSDIRRQLRVEDGRVVWTAPGAEAPFAMYDVKLDQTARIEFIEVRKGMRLTGRLYTMCSVDNVRMVAVGGDGEITECHLSEHGEYVVNSVFAEAYYTPVKFDVLVPMESVCCYLLIGQEAIRLSFSFSKFSPINKTRNSYALYGDACLSAPEPYDTLVVDRVDAGEVAERERRFEASVLVGDKRNIRFLRYRRENLEWRRALSSSGGRERIWLVSDRPNLANDNGEALFEYLQEHPVEGVTTYFVISRKSPDYKRLKRIGNVVPYGSHAHLSLTLRAEAIISSSADENVINPFGRGRSALAGMLDSPFVFLQHGVIKDDLSNWLHKTNKNISIFVTSAPREQASIAENPRYGYSYDEVLCSGLPRHDKLVAASNEKKKRLIIAPTWRNYLASPVDLKTGMREPNPAFENSAYFQFYDELLNDKRLKEAAARTGFEIRYLLHPSFVQELDKFESDFCEIVGEYNYTEELSSASIMLTDYSSVVFDFALLKRPILYAQIDPAAFFAGHTYEKGYYDYEKDGFGPICSTYDETVDQMIAYMENPVMGQEYLSRVDDFFFWPTEPRCKIVVDAIIAMLEKGGE